MNKSTVINIRLEEDTKSSFQQLCSSNGLTMSEVVSAFMEESSSKGEIPARVKKRCRHAEKKALTIAKIRNRVVKVVLSSYKSKIAEVSLFGSYSRGEAKPDDDIDLFLKPRSSFSAMDMIHLNADLEKIFKVKVNIVTRDASSPEYLFYVNRDKVLLYKAGR